MLDWISEELGEAAHLGRLDEADVVHLSKRDSIHPLRPYSAIGRRLPAHAISVSIPVFRLTDELQEQTISLLRRITTPGCSAPPEARGTPVGMARSTYGARHPRLLESTWGP